MSNNKRKFSPLLIVLVVLGSLTILFYDVVFTAHSKMDVVDKPNDKMIHMVNVEIDKVINDHTRSDEHKGYIAESRTNAIKYLKSLRSIESYARYGIKSTKAKNYIELRLEFNDGKVVDKIYTGQSISGLLSPSLLIKVIMENGRAKKVFTNGQEMKSSPDQAVPDINLIIDKSISYDISKNRNAYFAPVKTQKTLNKEWEL